MRPREAMDSLPPPQMFGFDNSDVSVGGVQFNLDISDPMTDLHPARNIPDLLFWPLSDDSGDVEPPPPVYSRCLYCPSGEKCSLPPHDFSSLVQESATAMAPRTIQRTAKPQSIFKQKRRKRAPRTQDRSCEHGRKDRSKCRTCSPGNFCAHGGRVSRCKYCGTGLCPHNKRKDMCINCSPQAFCPHKIEWRKCSRCKEGYRARSLESRACEHGLKDRSKCRTCSPGNFCVHGNRVSRCKPCGTGLCPHKKRKDLCDICSPPVYCSHLVQRRNCAKCKEEARLARATPPAGAALPPCLPPPPRPN